MIQNIPPGPRTQLDDGFSVLDVFTVLLRKKRRIAAHFLIISAAAVALSFVIPKKYKSTALFLPPRGESMMIPAIASLGLSMNFNNESDFSPQQIESLLDSRLILEEIIRRYDLMTVYKTKKKPNNLEAALKILRRNIKLETITESGLTQTTVIHYSLSVIDKDRERSAKIANDMVDLLNSSMENLSKQQEDYTVNFIGARLDSVVAQRARLQTALAAFQKTNKVYSPDMREQIMASVNTIAELKKQLILGEIERDLLLVEREKGNREVRMAEKRIQEIKGKIKALESNRQADVLPGLDFSVDVAYQYLEMFKEMEILAKLELLLRQQHEEAKIKNARRAPVVRVVDRAVPPQWKNSPKKSILVLLIVGPYMAFYLVFLLTSYGFSRSGESTRRKVEDFKAALRL